MPFTFSHPAIILPLKYLPKKWFSMTGLIIGSLTPDFEYFMRMKVESIYSHTISGIFWFDLPLAILLAFIFHNIVRNKFYENLPLILKSRLSKFEGFEWNYYFKNNWFVVIISVLIGAFSHLYWDSFTHANGYFVDLIPQLKNNIKVFRKEIPVFKFLQHGSSLLGAIVILFALFKIKPERNFKQNINIKYWRIALILSSIIFLTRFLFASNLHFGDYIVTGISAILISLIFTPIILHRKLSNF